ncbi:MAG TPA: hypothetical protein VF884_06165 [Nitrososphaeraceae archaeon]
MKNNQIFQSWKLSSFVIPKNIFLLLLMASLIILNYPVIFETEASRPLMIDVTAIIGAVVTAGIFFLNTSVKFLGRRHAEGFLAFTIGAFLWLGAEASWAYYWEGLGIEVPYPSVADLFWLVGYGFFLLHNYRLIAKLKEVTHIDRNMIVLVSAAVGLTLGYILNLTFGVAEIMSATTDTLSTGVSIFYPIIDGIILIPAMVIFWSIRKTDPTSMHWLLMSLSFVMVTIGDIGFGYSFALSPDIAGQYEWIWSIFFNACYVFMATGGIWYYLVSK